MQTIQYYDYIVQDNGLIFSNKLRKYLKQKEDKDGYLSVVLYENKERKEYRTHRLIAKLFVSGYSDTANQINHKNGDKKDNNYTNLEWVTCIENIIHSIENNLRFRNRTIEEMKQRNRESQLIRYSNQNDVEKERQGLVGHLNKAKGMNYLAKKDKEKILEIVNKRKETYQNNKKSHLSNKGSPIIINEVSYNSILEATKITGYSFKYIKRRIESKDYPNYYFKGIDHQ